MATPTSKGWRGIDGFRVTISMISNNQAHKVSLTAFVSMSASCSCLAIPLTQIKCAIQINYTLINIRSYCRTLIYYQIYISSPNHCDCGIDFTNKRFHIYQVLKFALYDSFKNLNTILKSL